MKCLYYITILFFSTAILISSGDTFAQVETAGSAVWQYSIDVKHAQGSNSGVPRAYLWVPPNATKLRGIVLAQNNMMEFSILENASFRDSMASINFGIVWVSPRYDFAYNPEEGAKEVYLQMMRDLAAVSGFKELYYVPVVPIGHSAFAGFPFAFLAGTQDRALCGISNNGMFPYDYNNQVGVNYQCGKTIDYIPLLTVIPEQEGGGQWTSNHVAFYRRAKYPYTPMTHLPAGGEWHFATTQRRTDFEAYYIKKIASIRLLKDATDTSLAVLKPIDPTTTGWLYDRWRVNMRPRYPAAPVQLYTGKKALIGSGGEENFWCVDEDMARRIEAYENVNFRKTPVLTAYNQSTVQGVVGSQVQQLETHLQNNLNFYPLNDSLDFELSASFLDTIPQTSSRMRNWVLTTDTLTGNWTVGKVGDKVSKPASTKTINISREIGPISKVKTDSATGITTFRMTMERGLSIIYNTNYFQWATIGMIYPGDATYRQFCLQGQINMNLRNTSGLAQTINFSQLPDITADVSAVPLQATSSLGMPVQYFIKDGPAVVEGSNLYIKDYPIKNNGAVKVTVVAWQWGRDAGLATRTTGKAVPFPGQQIQSAPFVENTFWVYPIVTPAKLKDFTAKLQGSRVLLSWETLTETNVNRFEIEKSYDGLTWSVLGNSEANNKAAAYQLLDNAPQNGNNYYRLKIVDKDGAYQYSKIASVFVNMANLVMYKTASTLVIKGGRPDMPIVVQVYDLSGNVIYNHTTLVSTTRLMNIDLGFLKDGIYIARAISQEFNQSLKFVKFKL